MTVSYDWPHRTSSHSAMSPLCLEDRFEIVKDIGDGSFGSVALARVRTAGANVARRGTMVAIKTMKKTFESFAPCLELREVIFLRALPTHAHLVPALDIFLDPMSKKLHICMEYMDGNLYQLMKARDHKCLDGNSVKSILFQILAGLDHIHGHNFFHRDIKPENILVSTSAPHETGTTFRRYSALVTPPSTPPTYTVKIADFGLARETQSRLPYTTYVSTRWYRAPEVLLRAGEYSAPVDIWAVGAMAVEIATLKPLFPGGNEVDQVWRVCEIMGSPGNWYNKSGGKVGGGDWREGTRLAQKLGFSFPKMAPHSMESILQPPQWPVALSNFVTWCLMWDPKHRPTSAQAMEHEFFIDAVDPLRPKSSSRLLGKKHSGFEHKSYKDGADPPPLTSKPSWFRKSIIRDSTPQHANESQAIPPNPSTVSTINSSEATKPSKSRPFASKRATWTNGAPANGAPMPILPSIRPISPLSDAVTAQANRSPVEDSSHATNVKATAEGKSSRKIGRQLSVASNGNHYADRLDAERALNGEGGPSSPLAGQKEGFFSHLRKRARRLSGRNQLPISPKYDDIEASAGCGPWSSNRSSMALDQKFLNDSVSKIDDQELDRALHNVRYSLEVGSPSVMPQRSPSQNRSSVPSMSDATIRRHHSVPHPAGHLSENPHTSSNGGPISTRTRRALQLSTHPAYRYETFNEEEELLDEELNGAHKAARKMERTKKVEDDSRRAALATKDINRQPPHQGNSAMVHNPYPTPSPSAKRNGVLFTQSLMDEPATPVPISKARTKQNADSTWPTPPYEENEWAASAAASIFAAGAVS